MENAPVNTIIISPCTSPLIGGGTIDATCSKEQILCSIFPELYCCSLFCERMAKHEAIIIAGVSRYSNVFTDHEFKYQGKAVDELADKKDCYERIPRAVAALDLFTNCTELKTLLSEEELVKHFLKMRAGFVGDAFCAGNDKRGISAEIEGKDDLALWKILLLWAGASLMGKELIIFTKTPELTGVLETIKKKIAPAKYNVGYFISELARAGRDAASGVNEKDIIANLFIGK